MAKPRDEARHESYFHDSYLLYQVLAGFRNSEEVKSFLEEMLTPSEARMLRRRWYISRLLRQGGSVREVAYKAKVGTDTVVRVSRKISQGKVLARVLDSLKKRESGAKKPETPPSRYVFG